MSKKLQVDIELPVKLIPIFLGSARYRCAYGGRGSGKTRSFALMAAIRGYQLAMSGKRGLIVCAREFMNSLSESSMSEIKYAIESTAWLADFYEIGERFIRTKNRRIEFVFCGLRHNLDSIKSKSSIHLAWIDEAEPVSEVAWQKLIPTIREEGSEIWVTWNPERTVSATHKRFRQNPPKGCKIVELNWQDNPWFPDVLNRERLADQAVRPDQYAHIWEGDFVKIVEGAYFASCILQARSENRITQVARDPILPLKAFWDLGGSGARSDATSIWIAQFVDRKIFILDYYEAQGQPLSSHIDWLRSKKYHNALMILPHDGATHDRIHNVSFQSSLNEAGFLTEVIPNQGPGAARLRIEAVRRFFPSIWFNEETTKGGLEALAWYHEKRDNVREIGLGPNHDWSSHAADSFGLMCIKFENEKNLKTQPKYRSFGFENQSSSWLTN